MFKFNQQQTINLFNESSSFLHHAVKGIDRAKNYTTLSTRDVVSPLLNKGYVPLWSKLHGTTPSDFSAHTLALVSPNQPVNGCNLMAVLKNSHEGTSSLSMQVGLFRIVCANGLIRATDTDIFRSTHVNRDIEIFLAKLPFALDMTAEKYQNWVQRMNNAKINWLGVKNELYDYLNIIDSHRYNIGDIRRVGDQDTDNFTRMNVLQENVIQGNYLTARVEQDNSITPIKARKVMSLDRQNELTAKINEIIFRHAA